MPCTIAKNLANQNREIVRMAEAEHDAAFCTKMHNAPCILRQNYSVRVAIGPCIQRLNETWLEMPACTFTGRKFSGNKQRGYKIPMAAFAPCDECASLK